MPIVYRSGLQRSDQDKSQHQHYVKAQDLESDENASTNQEPQNPSTVKGQNGRNVISIGATASSPPKLGTVINIDIDMITPPKSPSAATSSDSDFEYFACTLPFTLTINTINYPIWSKNEKRPLPYFPVPLAPLPDIPAIPSKHEVLFPQVMDVAYFKATIDEILHKNGYIFGYERIKKVWVSFTHKNGKRERLAMSAEHVPLITKPWAKDVWLGHLDCIAGNCACEECISGRREDGQLGHGLVIEVVFPQGFEKQNKNKTNAVGKDSNTELWAGKRKLPFHDRSNAVPRAVNYATSIKKVRFG